MTSAAEHYELARRARGGVDAPRPCGTTVLTRRPEAGPGPVRGTRVTCRSWGCPFCSSYHKAKWEMHLGPVLRRAKEVYFHLIPAGVWTRDNAAIRQHLSRHKARYRWFLPVDRPGCVEVLSTVPLDRWSPAEHGGAIFLRPEERQAALRDVLSRLRAPRLKGEHVIGGSRAWAPPKPVQQQGEEVFLGITSLTPQEICDRAKDLPFVERVDADDESEIGDGLEPLSCTVWLPEEFVRSFLVLVGAHAPRRGRGPPGAAPQRWKAVAS